MRRQSAATQQALQAGWTCQDRLGNPQRARQHFQQAVELDETLAEAWFGLGLTLLEEEDANGSADALRRALALSPGHPAIQVHMERALQYVNGAAKIRPLPFAIGQACFTKTDFDHLPLSSHILLWEAPEGSCYGIGDVVQWCRWARRLHRGGYQVWMGCRPSLLRLLQNVDGVFNTVDITYPTATFDAYLSLKHLPDLLPDRPIRAIRAIPGREHQELPAILNPLATVEPYLGPDPERVTFWQKVLSELPGHKIGINWHGSVWTWRPRDPRVVPFACFERLSRIANVQLVSLQKGLGAALVHTANFPIYNLGERADNGCDSFVDTAAAMHSLDLIISSDTSVAHVAAAQGLSTWLILAENPDGRWPKKGWTTPLYPSMRLFHLEEWGSWEKLFEHVAQELTALLEQKPQAPPAPQ